MTTVSAAEAVAVATVSERFEYDIKWGPMNVGKAILASNYYETNGIGTYVRSIEAKSNGCVSWLHRIDNRIESREFRSGNGSLRYEVSKQIREGRFRQHDVLQVNSESSVATWEDRLNGTSVTYEIPDGVKDYVSMMFELRDTQMNEKDAPVAYQLIMDDAVHGMLVSVVASGTVNTVFGKRDGLRLSVASQSPGLFVRNVPGAIWICPRSRIILSMEASTKLGNVRTTLSKWEINGRDASGQLTNLPANISLAVR